MEQENKKEEGGGLGKNKKYIIIGIVVILVVGYLVNGFFGKNAGERMAENILENQLGGNVDINSDNGSISVKSDKGNFSTGTSAKWPSDMPSDVPEFTAGNLTMAASVSAEGRGWEVAASGVSKTDFDAYHSLLVSKGWSNMGVFDANLGMVQMNKGSNQVILIFNPQENAIVLTVTVK